MRKSQEVFEETLSAVLARWDLPIWPGQLGQLRAHFEAVVERNRVMNLTRITEPTEAAVKHYADSMALLLWQKERRIQVNTILDMGTGAGFPAVPLAVMRPDWVVTAIDATRKKIDFLARTAAAIGLRNLHLEHAHTSHWNPGRTFPLITFRAVANLGKSLEQAAPHLAPGGWIVAYQTARASHDDKDVVTAALKLRLGFEECYPYALPFRGEILHRALLLYRSEWNPRPSGA